MSTSTCAPTDRILQSIMVRAPGVTGEMINLELFNVVDEFFRRTGAWLHRDEVALSKGVDEYNYGVPAGAEMVRMIGVTHNNIPVPMATGGGAAMTGTGTLDPALTFSDGDAAFAADKINLVGDVFSWAVYRPDFISIDVPNVEMEQYPAVLIMALTVSKGCLECDSCDDWNLPEWMWSMFFQDWLDGTLGRLHGMVAKPWSNTQMASYHGKRFRN